GEDHPLVVGCWLNLAGIEEKLGDWPESERLLKKAAAAWKEIYGPNHNRTLLANRGLGNLLRRWGRLDEAEGHVRQLLDEQLAEVDGNTLEIARTHSSLGLILMAGGKIDAAEAFFQLSLTTYNEVHGVGHVSTIFPQAHLALVAWKRGQLETAAGTLDRLTAPALAERGERHPTSAWMLHERGKLFIDEGRTEEAERALRRALDLNRQLTDGPSSGEALNLLELGKLHRDRGLPDEAESLFGQALKIFQNVLPAGHPDLVEAQEAVEALET
ncbi:MAG: tetratricopeptide repeat protein, partial [Acidobacteriota bacterium]